MSTERSQATSSSSRKRKPRALSPMAAEAKRVIAVIEAVATLLSAPRDRLGRLEPSHAPHSAEARETVRAFALEYNVAPARDYMEQCAQVLRAAVACYDAGMTPEQVIQFNRELETARRCNGRRR